MFTHFRGTRGKFWVQVAGLTPLQSFSKRLTAVVRQDFLYASVKWLATKKKSNKALEICVTSVTNNLFNTRNFQQKGKTGKGNHL